MIVEVYSILTKASRNGSPSTRSAPNNRFWAPAASAQVADDLLVRLVPVAVRPELGAIEQLGYVNLGGHQVRQGVHLAEKVHADLIERDVGAVSRDTTSIVVAPRRGYL